MGQTASSRILLNQNGQGYLSPFDAPWSTQRNRRHGVPGKLNCDEFAMAHRMRTAPSATCSPVGHERCAGRFIGRFCRGCAARIAPVATPPTTGGRFASGGFYRGHGTKPPPTYGRPSRWEWIAFASSLDTAGLIDVFGRRLRTRVQRDAGFDPKDSTSLDRPREDFARLLGLISKG